MTVQAVCKIRQQIIIFIEKRRSYLASLKHAKHVSISQSDLLLFLTKMDALLPETNFESSLHELLR